jgi:hypothetical protein
MSNTPPVPQAPQASPTTKPTDPKEGRYKGKAVAPDASGAPHEFGKSRNNTPELLVHLYVPDLGRTFVSPLYFSADSASFSEDRLRALGCADITTLAGIDTNEVDIEIKYDFYNGDWKLKVQIISGGGVFHTSNRMEGGGKEFAANIQATLGRPVNLGGKPVAGASGGGTPKPPF